MKFDSQIKGLRDLHKKELIDTDKLVEALFTATNEYIKQKKEFLKNEFGIDEEEQKRLFQKEIDNFSVRL
jgi:hypothetical protein